MTSRPRRYRIQPAFCSVPATSVTVGRVTPSIMATNSCVSGNSSRPTRSCAMSSQRASRCSTEWIVLHATNCISMSACACTKRIMTLANAPSRFISRRKAGAGRRKQVSTSACTIVMAGTAPSFSAAGTPVTPSRPIVATSTIVPSPRTDSTETNPPPGKYTCRTGSPGSWMTAFSFSGSTSIAATMRPYSSAGSDASRRLGLERRLVVALRGAMPTTSPPKRSCKRLSLAQQCALFRAAGR